MWQISYKHSVMNQLDGFIPLLSVAQNKAFMQMHCVCRWKEIFVICTMYSVGLLHTHTHSFIAHSSLLSWAFISPTPIMSSLFPGCHPWAAAEWQRSSTNEGSLIKSASNTYYCPVPLPWKPAVAGDRDLPRFCLLYLVTQEPCQSVPVNASLKWQGHIW